MNAIFEFPGAASWPSEVALRTLLSLAGMVLASSASARADSVIGNDPLEVKVLVLNYDPIVGGVQRLHHALGWNDPYTLATQLIDNVQTASHGFIQYRLAEWRDLDAIPRKADGFQYTLDDYLRHWQSGSGWHASDTADYLGLLEQQDVPSLVSSGRVDEVWLFGGPYFGYWESAMAGPGAFYINGGTYPQLPSSRPVAVMGFNYERGDAEAMHSLGHRLESSISRVFGGWNIENPQTEWDRFTANVGQTAAGPFGVGSVHFPANGRSDYDYGNSATVLSTADDWLNYPALNGTTRRINASAWGFSQEGYMKYWLRHLPAAPGVHAQTGRVNNWWKYGYNWTSYAMDGTPIATPEPTGAWLAAAGAWLLAAGGRRRRRAC